MHANETKGFYCSKLDSKGFLRYFKWLINKQNEEQGSSYKTPFKVYLLTIEIVHMFSGIIDSFSLEKKIMFSGIIDNFSLEKKIITLTSKKFLLFFIS